LLYCRSSFVLTESQKQLLVLSKILPHRSNTDT